MVDNYTSQKIVVDSLGSISVRSIDPQTISAKPNNFVSVINTGPQGPPGVSGIPDGGVTGQVIGKADTGTVWLSIGTSEEVDTKIATHAQAEEVHTNATSGRDYAALFQNGLS